MVELTNEQTRQLIDVCHIFKAHRAARKLARGSYRWKQARGHEYLTVTRQGKERSLGRRSPETEALFERHQRERETFRSTRDRLKEMARVNKALRLNRVPLMTVKILRALDEAELLGNSLFVIGTNAMYAYEAKAGVLFESGVLATQDFDLLWDAKKRIRLAASKVSPEGLLGVLKQADKSFSTTDDYGMRAQNRDGYFVDLFCPDVQPPPEPIAPEDLEPIPDPANDWLVAAQKIDETVIGEDGLPVRIVCVDPRIFALHKAWLSKQESRQPRSRPRDIAQAKLAAAAARDYLGLKMDQRLLRHLPQPLQDAEALLAAV